MPPEVDDLAAGRHGARARGRPRGVRVVRARPARDVPGPGAGRAGRAVAVVRRRPARRLRPAAGERRPRRHPLVPGRRSGRRDPRRPRHARPGLRHPLDRRRPRRRRPTTSSSGPAPRPSSTSTPPTAAWGPRAAGPTRSRRTSWAAAPTAGPGPCAPRPPAGDDPLGRSRPRVAPGERPHELGDAGARERLARAPPRRRPAATPGRSRRHLGPVPVRRASPTGSASRWRSRSRCRASATSASRRWSSRARTVRRCSTCATPAHRIVPGKPELPDLPSTYAEADDEAETLEVDLVDAPTGLRVTVRTTLFADRPVVARSLTLANGGGGDADGQLRDVGRPRPAGRRLAARHAERHLGARAPRPSTGPSSRAASRSAACAGRPATSTARSSPSAAPRRPRTPARRSR